MNNIDRINDIIKMVPDLKYDSGTGIFETDRRALYDFAELIIVKCLSATDSVQEMFFNAGLVAKDQTEMLRYREAETACFMVKNKIEIVFGIEDAPKT